MHRKEHVQEELPSEEEFDALLSSLDMPMSASDLGIDRDTVVMTVKAGKDIRDKYVLPRLLWDLGVLELLCSKI